MTKSFFITGTDTNIGKTLVSIALLHTAYKNGYITAAYKPVASGGKYVSGNIYNHDVLLLRKSSSLMLSYQDVNLYTFAEYTSPHIASAEECRPIDFTVISTGLHILEHKANFVLVEGIGGWFTPISDKKTLADWVIFEQLPVILVVGIKLGCINHAILTVRAIKSANLNIIGWIANRITKYNKRYVEYISSLKNLLSLPLIGEIPWLGKETDYINVSNYINFDVILSYSFRNYS